MPDTSEPWNSEDQARGRGTSPLDAGAPGERSGAPWLDVSERYRKSEPNGGASQGKPVQSRLNTPLSPATTMAANSQPAKVKPKDAHAAQPSDGRPGEWRARRAGR